MRAWRCRAAWSCLLLLLPSFVTAKRKLPAINGPVDLAKDARKSKFVVFANAAEGKNNGGYCDADGEDWRAWLPIFIARALGPDRPLLMWDENPADERRRGCRICMTGSKEEMAHFFPCEGWLKERGLNSTRFMIVAGTGKMERADATKPYRPEDVPLVYRTLQLPWVNSYTRIWHFPISRSSDINKNLVLPLAHRNFHVMPDKGWVKPVQRDDLPGWMEWCDQQPKKKDLMYIGRFHGWKGQLDFLSIADPQLLRGYTIHFYTSISVKRTPRGKNYPDKIDQIAARRGIQVEVHSHKEKPGVVAQHACQAMGLIHYAQIDANPRVVTEALTNGMPVLVSSESNVPWDLRKQPFVQVTSNSDQGHKKLNSDLAKFMRMLNKTDILRKLNAFSREKLNPPVAYHKICTKIGICEPGHSGAEMSEEI